MHRRDGTTPHHYAYTRLRQQVYPDTTARTPARSEDMGRAGGKDLHVHAIKCSAQATKIRIQGIQGSRLLVYYYCFARPTCRGPAHCTTPPLDYKRGEFTRTTQGLRSKCKDRRKALTETLETLLAQAIQHHNGRRVLRSGGLNYSKPRCSCVLDDWLTRPVGPLDLTLVRKGQGGCIPPPGRSFPSDIWRAR